MTHPADQPRRSGGGRLFAVFLAVVFLAVLGSSVGYLAGRQVQARHEAAQQDGDQTGGDQTGGGTPTANPTSRLPGTHCPDVSERDAKTQLLQVLAIKTTRSRVWICRDANQGLYYQGLVGDGDFTNDNSILLPDVRDNGDGSYLASNTTSEGTTKYTVSKKSLVIQQPGQDPVTEPVVSTGSG